MSERTKIVICPYCGQAQRAGERCEACGGLFEPLSRMATQISMGPWFIRDAHQPFRPGCSYDVICKMVTAGKIKPTTIMRGPTTRQFWTIARNIPGVAHLLGYCDECGEHVDINADRCPECANLFTPIAERNELGLQYPDERHVELAQKSLEEQLEAAKSGSTGLNRTVHSVKKNKTSRRPAEPQPIAVSQEQQEVEDSGGDLLAQILGEAAPEMQGSTPRDKGFDHGSTLLHFDDAPAQSSTSEGNITSNKQADICTDEFHQAVATSGSPTRVKPRRGGGGVLPWVVLNVVVTAGLLIGAYVIYQNDGRIVIDLTPSDQGDASGNPSMGEDPASSRSNKNNDGGTPGGNDRGANQSNGAGDATQPNGGNTSAGPSVDAAGNSDNGSQTPEATMPLLLKEAYALNDKEQYAQAIEKLREYLRVTPKERQWKNIDDAIKQLEEQQRMKENPPEFFPDGREQ